MREMKPRKIMILALGIFFGACVAMMILSTTAKADTNDAQFLADLNTGGVTYKSEIQAIRGGHFLCELLGDGYSETEVVNWVVKVNEGDVSLGPARALVQASERAYCPSTRPSGIKGGVGGVIGS